MTDEPATTDEPQPPPYRSYTWDGGDGAVHVTLYPGEEEADEERKAGFRAMGARLLADLIAEREAEHTPPFPGVPNLRLIHGEGRA
ncbi:hypothetical protein [Streptomyces sp. CBMA156]|uniref:hypothetical protein n=1 Tax=Streptomyces sp. CBMA156 TaxID=1930280 RepID=UPI001661DDFC|nr:hypothetical protein [Streptomyces sp. CBMA156]MBD0674218.1 hypothetical protein [Streptomyces sp. CBMA156]MBD0674561.1 hypothetical protein [Streptomyces sp. CBMA156]